VVAALELGWEVADLYAGVLPTPVASELPATLPAFEDLQPRQRASAGVARVSALIDRAGCGGPPSTAALEGLLDGDAGAWRRGVYDLHVELAASLHGREAAPARAYELGRSLADTSRDPHDLGSLIDRLEPARLLAIEGALADLSSKLPAHSAAAVAATLEQWKQWSVLARARESMDGVRGALSRQRALWRALLSGEKNARDMLDPDTAVAASVRHASRLGTMVRGLAGAYLPALAVLAVAAFLVLYVIIDRTGIATVVAALGALAATMIAIRKAVGLTVQETIDELRPRLWGAELDAAVAQSILRLPPGPPPAERHRLSLARSPSAGEGEPGTGTISQHVDRAMQVTRSARKQGFRVPASGPASAVSPTPEEGAAVNGKHSA
jgi:hypothetical protein